METKGESWWSRLNREVSIPSLEWVLIWGLLKKAVLLKIPLNNEERIYNIHTDEIKSRLEDIF